MGGKLFVFENHHGKKKKSENLQQTGWTTLTGYIKKYCRS